MRHTLPYAFLGMAERDVNRWQGSVGESCWSRLCGGALGVVWLFFSGIDLTRSRSNGTS